jgi:microcystin-dependent protein
MGFGPVTTTNAGLQAINVALATGAALNFYEVTGGSGFPAPGDVPAQFTQLKSHVMVANPTSVNDSVLYQTTYKANFDSAETPFVFQLNEMGVWYTLGGGSPFLFGYLTTGAADGDTITPSSEFASVVKDYIIPVVYANNVPVGTTVTITPSVELHGPRHLSTGVDPIPNASSTVNGLTPVTPADNTKVLRGGPTANWGVLPPHAPTHLDNGPDTIPVSTTSRTGLLPKLSGDVNSYLNGTGAWGASRIPGEVIDYAGAFPPVGWLMCDGQSYPTANYPALFSVIGYSYGGSGAVFAVPDLRSRVTVGAGGGPGLTNRSLASIGGEESHLLAPAEMPVHAHVINDPGHVHGLSDPTHAHSLSQNPHSHNLVDPGHAHTVPLHSQIGGGTAPGFAQYIGGPGIWVRQTNAGAPIDNISVFDEGSTALSTGSNISISPNTIGIGVFGAATGIRLNAAGTGITTGNVGGNVAHNNMQPYLALNKIIHI